MKYIRGKIGAKYDGCRVTVQKNLFKAIIFFYFPTRRTGVKQNM